MLLFLLLAPAASAQSAGDADHHVVYEFGWAGDWSRNEGLHPKGATFAFEIPAIERWLELEFGVEAIHADHTEVAGSVLFKKPWRFSPQVEFMAGLGPVIVHGSGPDGGTFWGLTAVLDYMFWPRKSLGWYVEPGCELVFQNDATHHGIGITAGLLIGR